MNKNSEYSGIVYDADGPSTQWELITGGSECETGGKFVAIDVNWLGYFSTSRKCFWHARISAVPEARIRTYESNRRFLLLSVSCAEGATPLMPSSTQD